MPALLSDSWSYQGLGFDVAAHLGTLTALLVYYRKDLGSISISGIRLLRTCQVDENIDLVMKICLATLPILVAGFFFQDFVEHELRSVTVIAFTTIFFGAILWWADHRRGRSESISWTQSFIIGLGQMLALIPGTSRSGITITVALFLGMSRFLATRFSFLLAIPTILGATVVTLVEVNPNGNPYFWHTLLTSATVSGLSAFICIHFFVKLIETTGMAPYAIYRIVLGLALLLFSAFSNTLV